MATISCNEPVAADLNRGQGRKYNSNTLSGKPGWERCPAPTAWVASEKEPDPQGVLGSISLCDECKLLVEKQGFALQKPC